VDGLIDRLGRVEVREPDPRDLGGVGGRHLDRDLPGLGQAVGRQLADRRLGRHRELALGQAARAVERRQVHRVEALVALQGQLELQGLAELDHRARGPSADREGRADRAGELRRLAGLGHRAHLQRADLIEGAEGLGPSDREAQGVATGADLEVGHHRRRRDGQLARLARGHPQREAQAIVGHAVLGHAILREAELLLALVGGEGQHLARIGRRRHRDAEDAVHGQERHAELLALRVLAQEPVDLGGEGLADVDRAGRQLDGDRHVLRRRQIDDLEVGGPQGRGHRALGDRQARQGEGAGGGGGHAVGEDPGPAALLDPAPVERDLEALAVVGVAAHHVEPGHRQIGRLDRGRLLEPVDDDRQDERRTDEGLGAELIARGRPGLGDRAADPEEHGEERDGRRDRPACACGRHHQSLSTGASPPRCCSRSRRSR
jgi:hypothetical protein